MKRLVMFLTLVALVACGSDEWSQEDKELFLRGCTTGQKVTRFCQCRLERAQERWDDPRDMDNQEPYIELLKLDEGCR